MAPNFDPSSFIPKEPMPSDSETVRSPSKSVNLLLILSWIILGFSLVLAGGVFGYKKYLENSLADKKEKLESAQEAFNPDVIDRLSTFEKQLETASNLLDNHIVVTPLFTLIQENTLQTVQFNSFQYQEGGGTANVQMEGVARGYPAVALQSEQFGQSDQITNPVFSNFSLLENGDIQFNVKFTIAPETISYQNTVNRRTGTSSTATSSENAFNSGTSTQQ